MFKLLVLSALMAIVAARPQMQQAAMSYSSPDGDHSTSFVANHSPVGSSMGSSSSSASPYGGFVSNSVHSVVLPVATHGGYYAHPHSEAMASGYAGGFPNGHANHFAGSSAYSSQNYHNGFNNGYAYFNDHQYQNGQDTFNGHYDPEFY